MTPYEIYWRYISNKAKNAAAGISIDERYTDGTMRISFVNMFTGRRNQKVFRLPKKIQAIKGA
jgi:hypothetical protein